MLNRLIEEKITQNAVSLDKYGINQLAWEKADAMKLIFSIMNDRIGVLGGDVYRLTSDRLEPLCDNWLNEPSDVESLDEFFLRSKSETLKYIEVYPVDAEEKILFSIIFTEKMG